MIRAYAIALAAGAQVFTLGIGEAIVGKSDTSSALFAGAGWVINLAVAEWVIRRRQIPLDRRMPQSTEARLRHGRGQTAL
jgi:hypothetical protein